MGLGKRAGFAARLLAMAAAATAWSCSDDKGTSGSPGDATTLDTPAGDSSEAADVTTRPLSPLAELMDLPRLLDPSTVQLELELERSGLVPGDFDEPVWQLGVRFESQTFLGATWTHNATLVVPDTLPAGTNQAAILQRSTPNPVAEISDSVSFVPQFGALTADRLDLPILLLGDTPQTVDLRNDPSLAARASDHPQCFAGPITDEVLLTECLLLLAEETDRTEIFPALPVAITYVRAVTVLQLLAERIPTFDLDFEIPAFRVDEVGILASGLSALGLRYAMSVDDRIAGVMAASADIGTFAGFYDLQQALWTSDYAFGSPLEQVAFWESAAAESFEDLYDLFGLAPSLADRTFLTAVGTNDPRSPLTSYGQYESLLPVDRAVLYVAGYERGFGSLDHLLAWRAFLAHLFRGRPWAEVSVTVEDAAGNLAIEAEVSDSTLLSGVEVFYVRRHTAIDDTDFRDAEWRAETMVAEGGGRYTATISPLADNTAVFVRVADSQDIYEGVVSSAVVTFSR